MKEIKSKKLALSAETIRPLSPEELDGVAGAGITKTIVKTVTWATRNVCPSVTIETATRLLGCNGNDGGGK